MKYFAYGTLKRKKSNFGLMEHINAKYVCDGVLDGYKMYNLGGYPMINNGKTNDCVHGEIFEVKDFDRLDILEGVKNGFYKRIPLSIKTDYGDEECFVYVAGARYEKSLKETDLIKDGIW